MEKKIKRLSKIMSEREICSRREADDLIAQKLVKVNGVLVEELGFKTTDDCEIEILSLGEEILDSKFTIMLNKPRDYVSSQPEENKISALELIRKNNFYGPGYKNIQRKGLAPLGRLDIDSTGLILYSNDGVLAKKIIGEDSDLEKEYEVNVLGQITKEKLKKLSHGLSLDGVILKPAQITQISKTKMIFILKEGRKRQIRRMCELVDLKVRRIHRFRIGNLSIGELPEGQWRFVNPDEILKPENP